MSLYNQAKAKINFNERMNELHESRSRDAVYRAYEAGEYREFLTREQAEAFSKNIETVVKNKKEFDATIKQERALQVELDKTYDDLILNSCSLRREIALVLLERAKKRTCDQPASALEEEFSDLVEIVEAVTWLNF